MNARQGSSFVLERLFPCPGPYHVYRMLMTAIKRVDPLHHIAVSSLAAATSYDDLVTGLGQDNTKLATCITEGSVPRSSLRRVGRAHYQEPPIQSLIHKVLQE